MMLLNIDEEPEVNKEHLPHYLRNLNYALVAYNLFLDLGIIKEAHQTLGGAYELQLLYSLLYKKEIGTKSLQDIKIILQDIETTAGIPAFESAVEPAYRDLKRILEGNANDWSGIPEEEVESYARAFLEAYELPEERLINIIADIRAYQIFERECENENIELLQDLRHLQHKETTYAEPPSYILRSKLSGIETKPNKDIHHLLAQFSTVLKKSTGK